MKYLWKQIMPLHSTEISRFGQNWLCAALLTAISSLAAAQSALPDGGGVRAGTLPPSWNTGGPKCMEMPEWQVHEYNPDLYILRQSGCTDFEKPFVFLFFGTERALLLDTGSRNSHIAAQIALTVHRWLERNHRDAIPLQVVHTHAHGDHVAGDAPLQALHDPNMPVTLIPSTVEDNQKFFGIKHWPEDSGSVDLGSRVIDAIPIPGHQAAGIALYDRQTGILFTGDSVYPGRLYVRDLDAYLKSNQRLVRFTEGKIIAHLIGNHIEQSRVPYLDYPVGTMYQPNEHELALPRGVLLEIEAGLESMQGEARRIVYRDFSLWPVGPPFDDGEEAFKKTQKQQMEHMWDQTLP
jgi:hydroxyacylglutathione hydrolase